MFGSDEKTNHIYVCISQVSVNRQKKKKKQQKTVKCNFPMNYPATKMKLTLPQGSWLDHEAGHGNSRREG